jgi:hypothetical protein
LQPRRRGGACDDHDAAREVALRTKRVDGAAHTRCLLPHGDIDADHVAVALRDHGVDGQRRLAGGMVADDQLALAPAEREQGVHHHQPGLHRLGHEIALDDRRRGALDRQARLGLDGALAVERSAERIHDPSQQRLADRHLDDLAGAEHLVTRLDIGRGVQKDAADQVRVQDPREPDLAACEPQHFVQPHIAQPRDHRHAIADVLDPTPVFGPRPQSGAVQRISRGGEPVRSVRRHCGAPA